MGAHENMLSEPQQASFFLPCLNMSIFHSEMSPADNPVGALFERYQTSGAPMPEIEVTSIINASHFVFSEVNMVAGQAHAPVFKARLSVCEGLVVTELQNVTDMADMSV